MQKWYDRSPRESDVIGSQHAVEIHDSRVRGVVSFAMA